MQFKEQGGRGDKEDVGSPVAFAFAATGSFKWLACGEALQPSPGSRGGMFVVHLLSNTRPSGGQGVLDGHEATPGCCLFCSMAQKVCVCPARQRCLNTIVKGVMNPRFMVCGEPRAAATKYSS